MCLSNVWEYVAWLGFPAFGGRIILAMSKCILGSSQFYQNQFYVAVKMVMVSLLDWYGGTHQLLFAIQ